jgi:hypothetical protein
MSAAANAAGYLYATGRLPGTTSNARLPETTSKQADAPRTPRIEYRKRRSYALPSPLTQPVFQLTHS